MTICPLCGREIVHGELWTEVEGVRVHWDCWVRAGRPRKWPLRKINKYVIPLSTQRLFLELNRQADRLTKERGLDEYGIEWGGPLFLEDEKVVLRDAVFGEKLFSISFEVPEDEELGVVGDVHYHPFGSGPSVKDMAKWLYVAANRVSPELRALHIVVIAYEGFLWHLFPYRDELVEVWHAYVDQIESPEIDELARTYFPEEYQEDKKWARGLALQSFIVKTLIEEGEIREGFEALGREDVVIELM